MFKRLLFGNEAKLHFKTSTTDGIARLYSEASIPRDDAQYWRSYVRLFDSANDVFTLLSIADVRRALTRYPENVATLVYVLVVHLEHLANDADFSPRPTDVRRKLSSPTTSTFGRLGSQAGSSALSLVDAGARSAVALGSLLGSTGGSNETRGSSSGGGAPTAHDTRDRAKEALNCCRILTRLLPIIMEGDHDNSCNIQADGGLDQSAALDSDSFEQQLLWSTSRRAEDDDGAGDILGEAPTIHATHSSNIAAAADESQEKQFVIEESDDDDDAESSVARDPLSGHRDAEATAEEDIQHPTPLGERLTKIVVDLLFYNGFTIPWTEEHLAGTSSSSKATSRVHYAIWEKGIGSSVELEGTTRAHESHRLELMRLLLVLLSKSMYVAPSSQLTTDNPALRVLATSLDRSVVLPLLCSLINASVVWIKGTNWLEGLASLPTGLVKDRIGNVGGEDVRKATIATALQLLNVMLGYDVPLGRDEADTVPTNGAFTPAMTYSVPGTPRPPLAQMVSSLSMNSTRSNGVEGQQNLFRLYLSKLHRQADFHTLADGIFTILAQRPSAAQLLNPSSAIQVTDTSAAGPHIPETLLLLWRLLRHNGKFRAFLLDDRSPQLLSHLLFHALNNKDSAARQGLVRLAVFILHDVSCDRAFAVQICKAGSGGKARLTGASRFGVAAGGGSTIAAGGTTASQASTGADILVQSVYALIATTKSALSALYAPLIITLTNVSPCFKNLSILSANRLLALFNSFSNPTFLLADEGNPRVLFFHLEVLNNIVQHGFQRNPNVAYAIVRNHVAIERLANFTLRRGIAEIRRSRRRGGLMGTVVTSPRSEIPPPAPTDGQAAVEENPAAAADSTAPASEKARGKMRRSSTSSDTARLGRTDSLLSPALVEDEEDELVNGFNEQELYYAASTVGRSGFVPSQAWVTSWHKGLPLDVLQVAVVELVPKVQELCNRIGTKSDADERVLALLREQNLDDVLPKASAPLSPGGGVQAPPPRTFKWTPQVSIWLLSYLWGLVYVTSSLPYSLFNGSCARLFQLRTHDAAGAGSGVGSTSGNAATALGTPAQLSTGASDASPRSPGAVGESAGIASVSNTVFGSLTSVLGLGLQSSAPRTERSEERGGGGSV